MRRGQSRVSVYLKLMLEASDYLPWNNLAQTTQLHAEIVGSYGCVTTPYQLLKSIMDEHILSLQSGKG